MPDEPATDCPPVRTDGGETADNQPDSDEVLSDPDTLLQEVEDDFRRPNGVPDDVIEELSRLDKDVLARLSEWIEKGLIQTIEMHERLSDTVETEDSTFHITTEITAADLPGELEPKDGSVIVPKNHWYSIKNINDHHYLYAQWSEDGKTKSQYLCPADGHSISNGTIIRER